MKGSIFNRAFWRAVTERAARGAFAALFAVYVSGNLVFDTTNVSGSLAHIGAIALGGAFSAFGLSVIGNKVSKNGPAFTRTEVVPESTIPTGTRPERGAIAIDYWAVAAFVVLVVIALFLTGAI